MAFELREPKKAKVLDVRTLAKKDRKPDESPGAQLLLQAELPATDLAMFSGRLPGWLFEKSTAPTQGKLDGLEGVELTDIGQHVKRFSWEYEQTGATVVVHRATTSLTLEDCLVHSVNLQPQKNGGVRVQWKVDAPGLNDSTRGKLTGMKATEIELTLTPPAVDEGQQSIPGTEGTDPNATPREPNRGKTGDPYPFPRGNKPQGVVPDTPAADATSTFVEAHSGASAAPEHPPERQVGDTTVITRRARASAPPPGAH